MPRVGVWIDKLPQAIPVLANKPAIHRPVGWFGGTMRSGKAFATC